MTGVDASPEMIRQASAACPAITFEVVDARRMTYESSFDAVFSNAALHWIREADSVADGVFRALRPGGRFVLEMGGAGNVAVVLAGLAHGLSAAGAPRPKPDDENFFPTIGAYATILESAGFIVEFARSFPRPTPLAEGTNGLRNWYRMFRQRIIGALPPNQQEQILLAAEAYCHPILWQGDYWIADYRRLQMVARKP